MTLSENDFSFLISFFIGLITFFLVLLFILYRQIVFVGKSLFDFKSKGYGDFTINDEINRRLEISRELVDEKIKCMEVKLHVIEQSVGKKHD